MGFDSEKFRELLLQAIGRQPRSAFAEACGISREHMSRMLRSDNPTRPSKTTLKKIADHSAVPYSDLQAACGYADSPEEARYRMSPSEAAISNAKDMAEGFRTLTNAVRSYVSIGQYMDEYMMLYSHVNVTTAFGKKQEYEGDGRGGAEYWIPGMLSFYTQGKQCKTLFVLFFSETIGGKVFVTDYAMDGQTLSDLGAVPKALEEATRKAGQDLCSMQWVYALTPDHSAEERLLKAIFDNDSPQTYYPYTEVGFGFRFEYDEAAFRRFRANHAQTFETKKVYVICANSEYAPGEVIASVMTQETGFPFSLVVDETDGTQYIMVSGALDEGRYDIDELKTITMPYARELCVKRIGECAAVTSRYYDHSLQFDVEPPENESDI